MTIAADIHASILAMQVADTGAGGLNNTGSAAYLRGGMFRDEDADNRSQNWPLVMNRVTENEDDKFTQDGVGALVRMEIRSPLLEKPTYTTQNAVLARLRAVYNRVVPAATSAWTFTNLQIRSAIPGPATEEFLRFYLTFRVFGREV